MKDRIETAVREAHDEVDARISRIKGLATGLDEVMDSVPSLCTNDPLANALRAMVLCILEQAEAAESFHDAEWHAHKELAKAA